MSPRVLFITHDPFGAEMGGGAIRAYELAKALAPYAEVTLAAPAADDTGPRDVHHVAFGAHHALKPLIRAADVVVAPPQNPTISAWLRRSRARLVYDLNDAAPFLTLELTRRRSAVARQALTTVAVDYALDALHGGHHFLCASGRQRDLWLGAMMAARLIGPRSYATDPSFRAVIEQVPFGLPDQPPIRATVCPIRDALPALEVDAEIVLWNGGIWNWLDPVTAVRATALLVERRPAARLVFMGRGPAGKVDGREAAAARECAQELGLLDRVVFFNDRWVPYAKRGEWLLSADCAVSTHHDHLETRFAFRSRLLDCFWAGLPMVCTGGDELAEVVVKEDLGVVVDPGDVEGVAAGVEEILVRGRESYAPAMSRIKPRYAWSEAAAPLVRLVTGHAVTRPLGDSLPRRLGRPTQRARAMGLRLARPMLRTWRAASSRSMDRG